MLSSLNCYLQDIRLDAQHLLWRMHLGYILHPQIPITKGMKIAELGTGTGYALTPASPLPSFYSVHYLVVLIGAEQSLDPGRCNRLTING